MQQSPFIIAALDNSDKKQDTPQMGEQSLLDNSQYLDEKKNLSTIQEEYASSTSLLKPGSGDKKFGKHMLKDSNNSSIMNIQGGSLNSQLNKSSSGHTAAFRDSSLSREPSRDSPFV